MAAWNKAVGDGRVRSRPVITLPPAPPNQSFAASCRQVHIAQARGDGSVVDNHCRRATV